MNNRKNKLTKHITAIVVFVLLSVCNVFFSVMLHKIFAKESGWMQFGTLTASIRLIVSIKGARLIFLTMELFIVLGLIAAQLTHISSYKSDLIKITDDIYIPKEMGEKQYGSARFYNKAEINDVFTVVKISKANHQIAGLMAHGYDDLTFIK